MTRQEAIACGAKTYTGKVCSKHPELEGLKYTSNGNCVFYPREVDMKRRKDL